jgi:hypothetical protein
MKLLHYDDPKNFWNAVKAAGCPFVRISARKAIFLERDLTRWLEAKSVGAPLRPVLSGHATEPQPSATAA